MKTLGPMLALLVATALCGCGNQGTKPDSQPHATTATPVAWEVCKQCGQAYDESKGAHVCQVTEACPHCKLQKGSPGCCQQLENNDHPHLCQVCGQLYDAAAGKHECKVTDACPICKRQKGSPGCCVKLD